MQWTEREIDGERVACIGINFQMHYTVFQAAEDGDTVGLGAVLARGVEGANRAVIACRQQAIATGHDIICTYGLFGGDDPPARTVRAQPGVPGVFAWRERGGAPLDRKTGRTERFWLVVEQHAEVERLMAELHEATFPASTIEVLLIQPLGELGLTTTAARARDLLADIAPLIAERRAALRAYCAEIGLTLPPAYDDEAAAA